MIYGSIAQFREKTTEKDMQELYDFLMEQPKKSESLPNGTWKFSYSSAANYLREKGFDIGHRRTGKTSGEEGQQFRVSLPKPDGMVTRSFSVSKDILERLDRICTDNWQYSRQSVFNELLDTALRRYGY